jgi:sugar lactone lactonase YvrE
MTKKLSWILCIFLLVASSGKSFAQQLYATDEYGLLLYQVNFGTGVVTTIFNTPAKPDGIIVTPQGNIVYTMNAGGLVEMFNPVTGVNTVLGSGLGGLRDLVMDPSGTSFLIAAYSPGKILRMNLTAPYTVTTLASKLKTVNGLAYDANGDLFAVADMNTVVQLDPVKGTTLKTLVLEPHYKSNGGDGMVYDSYTGQLWISHIGTEGNGLIEVPTNLSGTQLFQTGKILQPDGIASDGKGNLFISLAYNDIYEYNILTDTITKDVKVKGVDTAVLIPGTY